MEQKLMNLDKRIFRIIEKKSKKLGKGFFFIQIGSNDGLTGDPINYFVVKHKWKGILVEPIKYLFNRLIKNYNNKRGLIFKNVAVSKKRGYKTIYYLKEQKTGLPWWHNQLGSFYKKNVLKHKDKIKNIKNYLIKEKVKCVTINDILKKNKVDKIDLLHIDTEGYDYEIIKSLNFKKIVPEMIFYEHKHLNIKNKNLCNKFLLNKGYLIIEGEKDTLAYKKD